MELEDVVILALCVGVIIYFLVIPKVEAFSSEVSIQIKDILGYFIKSMSNLEIYINRWPFHALIGIILFFIFSYINYKLITKFIGWRENLKSEKESIKLEKAQFRNVAKKDITGMEYLDIKKFIESLERKINRCDEQIYLDEFKLPLKEKLEVANKLCFELFHKENIKNLEAHIDELEEMDEALDKQVRRKEMILEDKNEAILRDLQIYKNPVLKKDVLTSKEYSLLLKNGYNQINQYCVFEKKMITVLVRKISNHSLTHIFLVWSVMRLIEKYRKINHVKEHLSIDADITFEYDNNDYALEIETGTLLGKKEQIDEKIKYLNRKYPNRWLIIVSNKNLLWKYKKFGNACTRNEVAKSLEKMLKIGEN